MLIKKDRYGMALCNLTHVKTVEEYNRELRRQQEYIHGKNYCDIHDAIQRYTTKDCTYMELGVHQGGTATAAMLAKPKKIILIDVDFSLYNETLAPLAEKYCEENNIELIVKKCDSTTLASQHACDILAIDSKHTQRHMGQELNVHGSNVSSYIIAHDTAMIENTKNDKLYRTLIEFCDGWPFREDGVSTKVYGSIDGKVVERKPIEWKLKEKGETNVGYTVIEKIKL